MSKEPAGAGRNSGYQRRAPRAHEVYNITSADTSLTEDQGQRIKSYSIQMAIRLICFIGGIIADGWLRWVLFLAAAVLPYFAVVLANNTRRVNTTPLEKMPSNAPQLENGKPRSRSGSQRTTTSSTARDAKAQKPAKPARPEVIEGRVSYSPPLALTGHSEDSSTGGNNTSPDDDEEATR